MNWIKRKILQLYVWILKMVNANDVTLSKVRYFLYTNKRLNLDSPEEFVEKLQWLKLYYYKENYGKFADKYEVRKFVEETVGAKYLNTFIGVYDNVENIDFENLPNQFVLKGTHGSGYNIIVRDKTKLDINKTKKLLNKFLKKDYSKKNQEAIYSNIQPRILVENYLSQLGNESVLDFKFFCFNGVVKNVRVKTYHDKLYRYCCYDLDWNKIPEKKYRKNFLELDIPKPERLQEMIEIAQKLSKDFIFLRVDLYHTENKILFGELTFFDGGGIELLDVEEFNSEYGKLMQLPSLTN